MDKHPYRVLAQGDWSHCHPKAVRQKLQIYFQSKKKSGGGDCVVEYEEDNLASIWFRAEEGKSKS